MLQCFTRGNLTSSIGCDHFYCWLAAGASVSEKEAGKPSVRQILETLEYGPAPESPAVANAWLDDHGRSFGHFINNAWVKPSGQKTYDSINPATGEKMATTIQGMCMFQLCIPSSPPHARKFINIAC